MRTLNIVEYCLDELNRFIEKRPDHVEFEFTKRLGEQHGDEIFIQFKYNKNDNHNIINIMIFNKSLYSRLKKYKNKEYDIKISHNKRVTFSMGDFNVVRNRELKRLYVNVFVSSILNKLTITPPILYENCIVIGDNFDIQTLRLGCGGTEIKFKNCVFEYI